MTIDKGGSEEQSNCESDSAHSWFAKSGSDIGHVSMFERSTVDATQLN